MAPLLALATPLAVTVSIGRAACGGVLVKGGDALEQLANPGSLVLDNTGTLTEGHTTVVRWVGDADAQLLVLSLESGSSHPIAEGFRRASPHVAIHPVERASHVTAVDSAAGCLAVTC